MWNDVNQNGVTDAGELQSLAQLGITSISLQGSGNSGESLGGSPVTNRSSFTRADGSVGQVAAVDFQNDAIGAVAQAAMAG